ncbi:hypothetical protein ASG29_01890 [Sphingomonas sp. Leaf412]|uniref:RcnB family protein n=1 Tax=Sphingomonas sp. Leaf412 TaxID=1736370 RepID=UPI0006F797C0|nr:RcnB family protein [Sphingomonas sp. Leaf412]KQT34923.1 hypothetical protein ASG29_01890 [Sphingomonas sp. Leaf412]
MRKLILAMLVGATALPTMATAQSWGEVRRDRQDIREERRDLDRAYRNGDRREIRDQREDLRDARREYRDDRRDWQNDRRGNAGRNDWRGWRYDHRAQYARGNWRAPFRYQAFRVGARIQPAYYGGRYAIVRPAEYRLPNAYGNTRWVRHYDDVLLVDWRRGVVLDVIRNFFW